MDVDCRRGHPWRQSSPGGGWGPPDYTGGTPPPPHTPLDTVVLPAIGYRRERWRNGAGWTREIARGRGGRIAAGEGAGPEWDWRMSIAEIGAQADFSPFPGVDREQVLLAGQGLRLAFADGRDVLLAPPHGRHRYAGEQPLRGVPVEGPVHAFNLMWRRAALTARLWHRPLVGSMLVFAEPGTTWALHLMAGRVEMEGSGGRTLLEAGDTALLPAADAPLRRQFDGSGEALVVRLAPAADGAQ